MEHPEMLSKRARALRALMAYNPSDEEVAQYETMTDDELDELSSEKFLSYCDSFKD